MGRLANELAGFGAEDLVEQREMPHGVRSVHVDLLPVGSPQGRKSFDSPVPVGKVEMPWSSETYTKTIVGSKKLSVVSVLGQGEDGNWPSIRKEIVNQLAVLGSICEVPSDLHSGYYFDAEGGAEFALLSLRNIKTGSPRFQIYADLHAIYTRNGAADLLNLEKVWLYSERTFNNSFSKSLSSGGVHQMQVAQFSYSHHSDSGKFGPFETSTEKENGVIRKKIRHPLTLNSGDQKRLGAGKLDAVWSLPEEISAKALAEAIKRPNSGGEFYSQFPRLDLIPKSHS